MNTRDENGQALVMTALGFCVLLGFMALAVDVGMLFRAKRNLQTAADAAAVAGALDYLYNQSLTTATSAAQTAASKNGFTNGSSGVSVTVSDPPTDGPNAGNASFIEASVSKPAATAFMSLFGISSMPLKARAVAGTPTAGDTCIWLMSSAGTGFSVQGSYDIEAPNCGIYVNSPSSNALVVTGNGGKLNAAYLDVVGNSTSQHATSPTAPTLNAQPRTPPWGNLTGPTPSSGCTTIDSTTTSLTGTVTGPGAGNAVCYVNAMTLNNATLGPGVYMFENGVSLSGTVTVNSGTLDIYGGTFNQNNAILDITAPTSGTYDGIALMQPVSNANELQVQFGNSNQTFDGYVYAPGAEVYLQDHGGGVTATGVVAKWFYDQASTLRINSYDVQHSSTTLNRVVTLVE